MRRKDFFRWSSKLRFLTLLLFALTCVGNAWGATYYWKGAAVAVGNGKVAVIGGGGGSSLIPDLANVPEEEWQTGTDEESFQSTNVSSSSWSSNRARISFYAKADDGKYFWGWYSSPECTNESYVSGANPYGFSKKANAVSTNSASPTDVGTYYAKFSDNPIYDYTLSIEASTSAYDKVEGKRRGGVFTEIL